MNKRLLNQRLKKLEAQRNENNSGPVFIDILDDGMVEVYIEADGEKKRMTETEYENWCKRIVANSGDVEIDVVMGEWDEKPIFIDDI